ncbi:MAG: hypothetical protein A4E55_01368 [Pelotomaculum sp. PtaU1.Bin035]|nr:MAG: hypothetical protein A4E55_01368 [Pelotomaculum sp. PtaU1.Bin035]
MKRKIVIILTILICSLSIVSLAWADAQHLFTGGYPASDIQDLRYVLSGGDSSYQQNIMKAGANQWNSISSEVVLSNNSSGAKMSIYKSTTSTPGLFGEAYCYYDGGDGWERDLVGNQIWGVSDIYGYDNQMTASNLTNAQKKAVFTHEVGHALSLKHISSPLTGVMRQGLEKALSPTDTDEGHLTLKWGY